MRFSLIRTRISRKCVRSNPFARNGRPCGTPAAKRRNDGEKARKIKSCRISARARMRTSRKTQFAEEYFRQLDHKLAPAMERTKIFERLWDKVNPSPLLSFFLSCRQSPCLRIPLFQHHLCFLNFHGTAMLLYRREVRGKINSPFLLQKKAWRREAECERFRSRALSDAAAR